MTGHFGDRLHDAIQRTGTCACIGLDPRPGDFHPSHRPEEGADRRAVADAIRSWGLSILDAIQGEVPIVKLQSACYEAIGPEGVGVFAELCAAARDRGLLVIGDAKRGDIGSSADLYARAYLGEDSPFACDALTVNPYLGEEGIEPFFAAAEASGRGVFVLCKTSNPGSAELQDLPVEGDAVVFERIAARVEHRGSSCTGAHGFSSFGLVVGATYPEQGVRVRRQAPHTYFLVPGYGHQGGVAADLAGLRADDGGGIIVASSRGIADAWKRSGGANFSDTIREAVAAMKADLSTLSPAGASSGAS